MLISVELRTVLSFVRRSEDFIKPSVAPYHTVNFCPLNANRRSTGSPELAPSEL